MDTITKEERSRNMSRIRGSGTLPERKVRSFLHRHGFRFRNNSRKLPGKPDIVLPKYKAVVFVHGCFWHHHEGCRFAYTPKSNIQFWQDKLRGNQARDKLAGEKLKEAGWRVLTVWECDINNETAMKRALTPLLRRRVAGVSAEREKS